LPDATIGEILSSLERVELAARIEALYGIRLDDDLFAADPTVGELGARLRSAESAASSDRSPDARPELADRTDRPSDRFAPMSPSPAVSASPRPHISKDPPDAAPWRHRWPTRAVRFLLREGIMHPLARALLRIEIESSVPVEELPDPFLLAVNHASFIDPVVMFALPPRLRARLAPAARWNFFTERSRGKGLYYCAVLWLNLFPLVQLGDWRPTLRIAGELADRDHSILIYPEGEISRDDELHPFKQGVAVMSRELHLPIVPCATAGIERVLPPDSRRLRRASWRRPRVQVCIGEPLPPVRPGERLAARVQELERHVRRLRERARAAMR
jgi:long-chain acyl-CoA synthetase